MKFEYKKSFVDPAPGFESGVTYQPIIPIILAGHSGELRFNALVDTGSDQTILPMNDVESITGLLIDRKIISSVQGRLEHHTENLFLGRSVHLRLSSNEIEYEFPSSVWFSEDGNSPAILGHSGFLEYFTITFEGDMHVLILEPNKKFPGTSKKLEW